MVVLVTAEAEEGTTTTSSKPSPSDAQSIVAETPDMAREERSEGEKLKWKEIWWRDEAL